MPLRTRSEPCLIILLGLEKFLCSSMVVRVPFRADNLLLPNKILPARMADSTRWISVRLEDLFELGRR